VGKVNYTVEELMGNPSFKKWVEGKAPEEETRFWDRWVSEDESNFRAARQAEAQLLGVSFQDAHLPPVEQEWQKMRPHLLDNANMLPHSARRGHTGRWLYRAAAILLVGLIAGASAFVIYQSSSSPSPPETAKRTVTTDYGEQKTVHFSDGSQVIMNANSSICYQPNSTQRSDLLIELEGEAYFSVKKRASTVEGAFRVKTADGTISVLGTKFAVSTRAGQTQVVLEEGLVGMNLLEEGCDQKEEKKVLRPGELAQLDRARDSVFIKKANPKVYTSWATPTLVFDQTLLKDVAHRIEHTFGVEVIITDSLLSDQKISGSVENSELDIILSALSNTTLIPIQAKNDRVYIGELPSGQAH